MQSEQHLVAALNAFAVYCKATASHASSDLTANFTHFHSSSEPKITVADYVMRLHRQADADTECVLLAFVLLGRYAKKMNKLPSPLSVHRLMITALRIVTKVHHDCFRSSRTFSKAGGLRTEELRKLESYMLTCVDFDVFFRQEDLDHVKRHLEVASKAQSDNAKVNSIAAAMRLPSPIRPVDFDLADSEEAPHHRHAALRFAACRAGSVSSESRSVSPQQRSLCTNNGGSFADLSNTAHFMDCGPSRSSESSFIAGTTAGSATSAARVLRTSLL